MKYIYYAKPDRNNNHLFFMDFFKTRNHIITILLILL